MPVVHSVQKFGVAVAILDVLKATIAMVITNLVFPEATIYAGFFATLGHCFPVFAKFKGGKAVSTAMGFLLGISILVTKRPVLHFIVPVLIFFAALYLSKMVSLSAMISVTTAVVILGFTQENIQVTIAFAIIAAIVIYRHRSNIQRILDGSERKITWMQRESFPLFFYRAGEDIENSENSDIIEPYYNQGEKYD